jgi:hypothetical protein
MEIKHGENRFYLETPHGDAELLYKMEEKVMVMYHTFVPEEERGKGLAEVLTREAFTFAIKNGFLVKPACTYVLHFVKTHEEFRKHSTFTNFE